LAERLGLTPPPARRGPFFGHGRSSPPPICFVLSWLIAWAGWAFDRRAPGRRLSSLRTSPMPVPAKAGMALLKRLRNCEAWLEHLVGTLLGGEPAAHGRRIRLLDGTTVPKAGRTAKQNNGLWRLHCAFDLPAERFSFFALTDGANVYRERQALTMGGEQLDRVPVAEGDILIADRGFMHPDRLARVCEQGVDPRLRGDKHRRARWLEKRALARRERQAVRYAGCSCGRWECRCPRPSDPRLHGDKPGSGAKKLRPWRCALLPSANRPAPPKYREPRRAAPRNEKATPSPPARSPPPNGSFLSPRSKPRRGPAPRSAIYIARVMRDACFQHDGALKSRLNA
jgi:hypothetical protein